MSERPQIVNTTDDRAAEAPISSAAGIARGGRRGGDAAPHSHKFSVAMALLGAVAVAAVAVALVVISDHERGGPAAKWSSWSPPDSGTAGAREIADHLAPFYRITAVDQLDVVTVVNLANASTTSTATTTNGNAPGGLQVAVRSDPSSSQVSLLSGHTIAYNLCGIGGSNCSIGVGTASTDRLLLLRRQALELALYTFKYIGGVQSVVAILPPGHTQQASTLSSRPPTSTAASNQKPVDIALLFLRDELKPWLSHPLSDTFPEQFPPAVPELSLWRQTPEAGLVAQITSRGLFSERMVRAQDGSNLIVLDPLPPQ